jgi:exonuclease III
MLGWFLLFSFFIKVLSDTECPYVTDISDRRDNKNTLRLVQYNVEWLFIDYYSAMNCPGDGCTWKNETEAYKHLDYVTNVVEDLNPDIINFCEIEGCDELNLLKDSLDNSYNPYLIKGTDTATGQNVGMLTRVDPIKSLYRSDLKYNYPISGSKCGYNGSTGSSGVSKHYITEFNFSNYNIAFIAAHLLAIPTDPTRCAEREAQASVLQNIIYSYITKNYEIIMIGDFNDYDGEIPDINNNKPISKVLDILKGNEGDYANLYKLYSVSEQIPQHERYSDWWDSDNNCDTSSVSDYSIIDHILVTDKIRQNIKNAFIYHSYNEFCGKYNSDHYPVVVDLIT